MTITNELELAVLFRDACAVKRYHTVRTLRQQTVGEHTMGILTLLNQIYPEARKEVLLAVMHHDFPELVTGDIPAPIKRQIPRLALLLNEAEEGTAPLHQDFDLSAFEEAVVKFCDLMELVLWCLEECRMGNQYARLPLENGLMWLWGAVLVLRHPSTMETALPLLKQATHAALNAGANPSLMEKTK